LLGIELLYIYFLRNWDFYYAIMTHAASFSYRPRRK